MPTATETIRWLWPEYCPGPFFWGWWLYERDRNDGSINDDGGWGWLKYDHHVLPVVDLLRALGRDDFPRVPDYPHIVNNRFFEWFAEQYPQGIQVRVVPTPGCWSRVRYELIERPPCET